MPVEIWGKETKANPIYTHTIMNIKVGSLFKGENEISVVKYFPKIYGNSVAEPSVKHLF